MLTGRILNTLFIIIEEHVIDTMKKIVACVWPHQSPLFPFFEGREWLKKFI